jgi:uncharacterized membrane protein
MRMTLIGAVSLLLLSACGSPDEDSGPPPAGKSEAASPAPPAAGPGAPDSPAPAPRWDLQSSGEGVALALPAAGNAAIRLFCPAGRRSLLVNVPAFRPIGSEEGLSFGSGGEVVALVADPRGDAQRGGVSGTGAVPENLAALVAGPLSASYGAQASGPHPAPPRELARDFVAACGKGAASAPAPTAPKSPCLIQAGQQLDVAPLHAVGTEPFWSARVEGRCVTYSHPEDQKGTRVWTRYAPGRGGGSTWSGTLGGRRFEMRSRPDPRCSDGMSDKVYPIAVDLLVGGEERKGCAEPL